MFVNFYGKIATDWSISTMGRRNSLLTISSYRCIMIRRTRDKTRMTLILHTPEGLGWPLRLSSDCVQFIGCYRRVENFGPASGLLHFLPGHIA